MLSSNLTGGTRSKRRKGMADREVRKTSLRGSIPRRRSMRRIRAEWSASDPENQRSP